MVLATLQTAQAGLFRYYIAGVWVGQSPHPRRQSQNCPPIVGGWPPPNIAGQTLTILEQY